MAASAIVKLQPSKLSDERELLSDDVDLSSLQLALKGKQSFQLREAITAARVTRTMKGASTLKITVLDRDLTLFRSGYLTSKADVKVDGLWFRLAQFEKQGRTLTLTFEDREVRVLRAYPRQGERQKLLRSVNQTTRQAFAKLLAEEPKRKGELAIRFHSPAFLGGSAGGSADRQSQAEKDANRRPGFAPGAQVTVKGDLATPKQRALMTRVLDVGLSFKNVRPKVLVAAVMVVTQESTWDPSATNGDHVGLFQQSAADGWPATRNAEADAYAFFKAAISDDQRNPNLDYATLADDVQVSGQPEKYAQWKDESVKTVEAFGVYGTDAGLFRANGSGLIPTNAGDTTGFFTRGHPTGDGRSWVRETNWDALQRLASEVDWDCFCVSGTVWFADEPYLFKSRPLMRLSEDSPGVDTIDCDFDTGKKNATVTVTCRAFRWAAPPGSVVELYDLGPISGRWLVQEIDRDLFSTHAEISLVKPTPVLPERKAPEYGAGQSSGTIDKGAPAAGGNATTTAIPTSDAQATARKLLEYAKAGKINRHPDIVATAQGQPVRNQGGVSVRIDARVVQMLLWLLELGHSLEISAMCSDHSVLTSQGRVSAHGAGRACDIGAIDGVAVNRRTATAKQNVLGLCRDLRAAAAPLRPTQLISGGYGNNGSAGFDADCQRMCIPSPGFYGDATLAQHTNHVHVGY